MASGFQSLKGSAVLPVVLTALIWQEAGSLAGRGCRGVFENTQDANVKLLLER